MPAQLSVAPPPLLLQCVLRLSIAQRHYDTFWHTMFALKGAPEAKAEAAVEACLGKSVKMFSLFAISVAHSTN